MSLLFFKNVLTIRIISWDNKFDKFIITIEIITLYIILNFLSGDLNCQG